MESGFPWGKMERSGDEQYDGFTAVTMHSAAEWHTSKEWFHNVYSLPRFYVLLIKLIND